eukprot:1143220-Pelagomonas_calceolata.AAC.3
MARLVEGMGSINSPTHTQKDCETLSSLLVREPFLNARGLLAGVCSLLLKHASLLSGRAVTGAEDVCITHMLYADDLTLLTKEAGTLQTVLCRLTVFYARKKHIIPNEIVSTLLSQRSFTSTLKGVTLLYAENASGAMLTSAYRVRRLVREHSLANRLHASLWLAKSYVVPASICANQDDKCWTAQIVRSFESSRVSGSRRASLTAMSSLPTKLVLLLLLHATLAKPKYPCLGTFPGFA